MYTKLFFTRNANIHPFDAEAAFTKAQECRICWNPYNPCHVGIDWVVLAEYYP